MIEAFLRCIIEFFLSILILLPFEFFKNDPDTPSSDIDHSNFFIVLEENDSKVLWPYIVAHQNDLKNAGKIVWYKKLEDYQQTKIWLKRLKLYSQKLKAGLVKEMNPKHDDKSQELQFNHI